MALTTHGLADGRVSVAQFVAKWRDVIDQAKPLVDCLNPDDPQGGYVPFQRELPAQCIPSRLS